MEYAKPWLSVDDQIDRLEAHGIHIEDHNRAAKVLQPVGHYRFTGYLYPFRRSEQYTDTEGARVSECSVNTSLAERMKHADQSIDFNRQLRMLVMEGVERIEVAVRMRVGYVLGRRSAFAHEDPTCFTAAFTAESTDVRPPAPSTHVQWLQRVNARKAGSDEQFVGHFQEKYDNRMPVWALTEFLELGQLSVLYRGLQQQDAEEVALAYSVLTKKLMDSWLASLNYVRKFAAHHARLFNRKLQNAPSRPKVGQVDVLDHLRREASAKRVFGTYNALAAIAYLLRSIESAIDWPARLATLLEDFPESNMLTIESAGASNDWRSLDLWQ